MTLFSELGLDPVLMRALEREGYTHPTPIQAQAIPALLKGHDLLGIAQTGTGKTAAFALPILHHLLKDRKRPAPNTTRALILSPTRELASQIADSFKAYGAGLGLQVATIYGGVKYNGQYKSLAGGLDILVATPGRLIDHIQQKTVDLRSVECFVLDEADQMLDMGFVKPIRQIVAKMAGKRQNLFFSATMPKEIAGLAAELLTDPKKVEITPEATTAERVTQHLIFVEHNRKRALLQELYTDDAFARTLVFTRTKHLADKVAAYLQAGGVEAAAIHGNKSQGQRERALELFRAGRVRALVATDIAARGIDIDDVTHVINYDLPQVPEAYVHRIGRTARAGKGGMSISFCADDERNLLKMIQKTIRMTITSFDRRKDHALTLLDEAIMAANPGKKPTMPEREKPARAERPARGERGGERSGRPERAGKRPPRREFNPETSRHVDGDAEFVHSRERNRPARDNDRKPFVKSNRPAYDPMAADRPAGSKPEGRHENRGESRGYQGRGGNRPDRTPREDRGEGRGRIEGRGEGYRGHKSDRPQGERSYADRADRPQGERERAQGERSYGGKPGGKPGAKPFRSFRKKTPGKPFAAEAPINRAEGVQLKRRKP